MVEVGGRPILWHIMKHYSYYGFNEFVIALGYKGEMIKQYFLEYPNLHSNLTVDLANGEVGCHSRETENWKVHLIDTGEDTNTGGRIKRLERLLAGDSFMLTYGDGVSNVNLQALVDHHNRCGKLATITAVRPPARFGGLELNGDGVAKFTEKPLDGEVWINGGYMVCKWDLFKRYAMIEDKTSWEIDILQDLAIDEQLAAYRHSGFWQCMDTLRDKRQLESLWHGGNAPWRMW
jgi:glucose-1-phosphate cytidylyltransferase